MTLFTTFANLVALVAVAVSIVWLWQLKTLSQSHQLSRFRWLLIGLNGVFFLCCFMSFFVTLAQPYLETGVMSLVWPLLLGSISFTFSKTLRILDQKLFEDDRIIHSSAEQLQDERDGLWRVIDAIPGPVSWISFDLQYMGMNRFLRDLLNIRGDVKEQHLKVGFSHKNNPFESFVRDFFETEEDYSQRQMKLNIRGVENTYTMIARKLKNGNEAIFIGVDSGTFKDLEALKKSA